MWAAGSRLYMYGGGNTEEKIDASMMMDLGSSLASLDRVDLEKMTWSAVGCQGHHPGPRSELCVLPLTAGSPGGADKPHSVLLWGGYCTGSCVLKHWQDQELKGLPIWCQARHNAGQCVQDGKIGVQPYSSDVFLFDVRAEVFVYMAPLPSSFAAPAAQNFAVEVGDGELLVAGGYGLMAESGTKSTEQMIEEVSNKIKADAMATGPPGTGPGMSDPQFKDMFCQMEMANKLCELKEAEGDKQRFVSPEAWVHYMTVRLASSSMMSKTCARDDELGLNKRAKPSLTQVQVTFSDHTKYMLGSSGSFLNGDNVRLQGLSGRPELNGSEGVLGDFVAPKGRWTVRLVGTSEELLVRPANLASSRGRDLATSPEPPPGEDLGNLVERQTVELRGLQKTPELNGQRGVCVAFVRGSGRWLVQLHGSTRLVRAENLAPLDGGLAPGITVELMGLQVAALNGERGSLGSSFDSASGRWTVKLKEGRSVKVRPQNLRRMTPEDQATSSAGIPVRMLTPSTKVIFLEWRDDPGTAAATGQSAQWSTDGSTAAKATAQEDDDKLGIGSMWMDTCYGALSHEALQVLRSVAEPREGTHDGSVTYGLSLFAPSLWARLAEKAKGSDEGMGACDFVRKSRTWYDWVAARERIDSVRAEEELKTLQSHQRPRMQDGRPLWLTLKVWIDALTPAVWRRVRVSGNLTFAELHDQVGRPSFPLSIEMFYRVSDQLHSRIYLARILSSNNP